MELQLYILDLDLHGTSYSGGSGGGGADGNFYSGSIRGEDGHQNGGTGGAAYSYRNSSSWAARYAGGGAGNIGGTGKNTTSGQTTGGNWIDGKGENGTGGLLMIYADKLSNNGDISSNR